MWLVWCSTKEKDEIGGGEISVFPIIISFPDWLPQKLL